MVALGACEADPVSPSADQADGAGGGEESPQGGDSTQGPATPSVARGAEVYAQFCAFCHGAEGEGYTADNANALANPEFLAVATDDFLTAAVVHGRPATPMSAWGEEKGGPLDAVDVASVVALIRSWQTSPSVDVHSEVVEGVASRGKPIYSALCASCHGAEGEGVSAVSLSNPWFLATASDGYLRYAIEMGRSGTPMAAFGDKLKSQETADLVALIRSWQVPVDGGGPAEYVPDYTKAVINPEGEMPSFELREGRFVAADAVKEALDSGKRLVLLDARATSDFLVSRLAGAISVPFYDAEKAAPSLPKDTFIVAYCGCPHAASGQAVDALAALGFELLAVLDEGFFYWEEQGYPMEYGDPVGD
jgi:cytochrome c oxidase cbb3-type subunit 3/ubiquinol-cytochrome c reductase cytochrome c subunit